MAFKAGQLAHYILYDNYLLVILSNEGLRSNLDFGNVGCLVKHMQIEVRRDAKYTAILFLLTISALTHDATLTKPIQEQVKILHVPVITNQSLNLIFH